MIFCFLPVSPFGIRKFSNLSRFLWRLFCMFVSFQFFHFRICTSLMILKKGSNKTTRSSVWYFVFVYFLYFLQFRICKGLKTWKYGGHEASWSDVWEEYDSDCLARASRAYYLSYAFCLHVIVIITTCNLIITIIFSSLIMSVHGILSNQVFIGQKTKFLVYLWSLSIQFRPTWSLSAILIQKYHVKVFLWPCLQTVRKRMWRGVAILADQIHKVVFDSFPYTDYNHKHTPVIATIVCHSS